MKKQKKKKRRYKHRRLRKAREVFIIDGVRLTLKQIEEKCSFHPNCGHIYVVMTSSKNLKGKMKVCNGTLNDLKLYAEILKEERK